LTFLLSAAAFVSSWYTYQANESTKLQIQSINNLNGSIGAVKESMNNMTKTLNDTLKEVNKSVKKTGGKIHPRSKRNIQSNIDRLKRGGR